MKINLITKKQHETILNIFKTYPIFTLQNKGYEGVNRNLFTDEENEKDKKVNDILKSAIFGFRRFQNFRLDKNNELQIRFQYNYNYNPSDGIPFIGVGYILADELLNGFRE